MFQKTIVLRAGCSVKVLWEVQRGVLRPMASLWFEPAQEQPCQMLQRLDTALMLHLASFLGGGAEADSDMCFLSAADTTWVSRQHLALLRRDAVRAARRRAVVRHRAGRREEQLLRQEVSDWPRRCRELEEAIRRERQLREQAEEELADALARTEAVTSAATGSAVAAAASVVDAAA